MANGAKKNHPTVFHYSRRVRNKRFLTRKRVRIVICKCILPKHFIEMNLPLKSNMATDH